MLGRLFKQQSTPSLHSGQPLLPSSHHPHASPIPNSYDDSYMREILYGTTDPLKSFLFNKKLFRIVICQDGGSLRSKQVLYDSNNNSTNSNISSFNSNSSSNSINPILSNGKSKKIPTQKVHHINDLNDYMFGCGIPTNESQSTTKLHILTNADHTTSNGGSTSPTTRGSHSVLITRLFSFCEELPSSTSTDRWNPTAALPIKEVTLNRKVNSRFSIGLIIPIEDDQLSDIIIYNWNEISHFLIILQKLITKRLIFFLENTQPTTPNVSNVSTSYFSPQPSIHGSTVVGSVSNGGSFISNRRIQFPSYILQNEVEINNQLLKLIKLINYNYNVPRLINLNQIMLNPVITSTISYNWVSEILNWLEYKDGNISFLASLFSAVFSMRQGLKRKPLDGVDKGSKSRNISRIVIMTGNPLVAKKLIFIINGLIPNNTIKTDIVTKSTTIVSSPSPSSTIGCIESVNDVSIDEEDTGDETDQYSFDGLVSLRGLVPPSLAAATTFSQTTSPKPIPIRQGSVTSGSMSSPDSIKGWEIPQSSFNTSISKPRIQTDTNVIPIVQQAPVHRSSLSKSTSMAYLSSSLNSSLSSSVSNYSLTKLSGSFLDKWKNFGLGGSSVNNGNNNNSINSSLGTNSSGNYNNIGFMENGETPNGFTTVGFEPNISKRGSIQSLRSPTSPAIESEEFFETYGNITNLSLSAQKNLSRTQSMFDINEGLTASVPLPHDSPLTSYIPTPINRTRGSVFSKGKNVDFKNQQLIKSKCLSIMSRDTQYKTLLNKTLIVEKLQLQDDDIDNSIGSRNGLLPNVAFSDEFRPEFILQSCPVNPKLESLVMNAMKNDLLFYQNNCGVEHVNSKTLFISLRAREIKTIEMSIGSKEQELIPPISPINGTPNSGHSIHSGKTNNYKTTVRKIFTTLKNCGNKESIANIERRFSELNDAFMGNRKERDLEKVRQIVVSLIE